MFPLFYFFIMQDNSFCIQVYYCEKLDKIEFLSSVKINPWIRDPDPDTYSF